jgi:hypothetical protein
MTQTVRGRLLAATAALVLTTSLGACSGSGDEEPAPSAGSPEPSAPPPLETTVTVGNMAGKVRPAVAEKAAAQVARAVDLWWDNAFVAVSYPTTEYTRIFGRFTPGARREARADASLMTAGGLGERIDGVTAKRRHVTVDLLGVKGEAVAATARMRLVFRTTGSVEKKVTLTGSLRLTPTAKGWRVFAYDVAKGSSS